MTHLLEARHISKQFTEHGNVHRVLDDVSFSLSAGECVGLVGRSGCGKSTLARIVARLEPADSGAIMFDGQDIAQFHGKKRTAIYEKMQMIFQQPRAAFNPRQTLGWSITEGLRNRGMAGEAAMERAAELLGAVGLPETYLNRYPHEVSGGECQRAAIARALAPSPKLLISDEATSALDATVQREVLALLKRLCKERDIACLFITHDLALTQEFCGRLLVMQHGRIVEEGNAESILLHPQSDAARELLGAML